MQAFRIDAPGSFSFVDIPPPALRPGEVLVRIDRVGLCGTDLSTFRGKNPLVLYPRIPGHEIGGTIVETGPEVPAPLPPGTQVTVMPYTACGKCPACRRQRQNACENNETLGVQRDGAFTSLLAVPWQKLLRARLNLRDLALVEPMSVGFHAAARGEVHSHDTVLVIGCGMIGLGAIAGAALHRGATVIAADIDDAKLALAQKAGACSGLRADAPDFPAQLAALCPDGPAVVIEAVGSPATYVSAVDLVAFAGRVVYIGYTAAPVTYDTKLFVKKELDIRGARNALPEDFAAVISLLESGRYPAEETVTRVVSFRESGRALASWSADPSTITKIQVDLTL
jgi:L-galactonate 5-dehydrogenase